MTLPEPRRESRPGRWDPLGELEDAYDRMGRLFRDAFGEFSTPWGTSWTVGVPLDIEETEDAYIAEMDLPGVKREDLMVEVQGDEIRVRGEIKERERTGVLRRQTRRKGVVEHRFSLPGDFDPEAVEAELAEGVLTVRAPKAVTARPRRIDVQVR